MTIHPLAYRYARAVLDLAEAAGQTKTLEHDLEQLKNLTKDEHFDRLTHSLVLSASTQQQFLKAILKDLKASELTQRWVGVLIQNRRLSLLPECVEAFQHLIKEKRGEVVAFVTTAHELSKAQEKELQKTLEDQISKKISLQIKVDPSLWGGMIVRIGSTMIDLSLKSKLQRIHLAIKGVA